MDTKMISEALQAGQSALGIELGSTRIKAVLIGPDHTPLASGAYEWENQLADGLWTYPLAEVWTGIQAAYRELAGEVESHYGVALTTIGAMGVSAMMHGYLPFDGEGRQIAPFRTWRNTVTEAEAAELTELFGFNIPQRWSVAHLYRALRLKEPHVPQIRFLTTLAGYVHWQLTGKKVLGTGEASGMFPLDSATQNYDDAMLDKFDQLAKPYGLPWSLRDILPAALTAGGDGGTLTPAGALLLDPSGQLQPGIPFCPPEGDAGTGMVATNSVSPRTGNVSAGTSIFAMVVLEKPLARVYPEIDMVTTPTGKPVAMVHCNTCTSDLDAWVKLFNELLEAAGAKLDKSSLYTLLYQQALKGQPDCGGLVDFNCFSGEPVLHLESGCPMLLRKPLAPLTLGNFMRAQLYAALAPLRLGMDLLAQEKVALDKLYGHGGLFKVPQVAPHLMASALQVPVAVLETAGEGGPWGMALLAMFRKNREPGEALESYLNTKVFSSSREECQPPSPETAEGFARYLELYKAAFPAQKAAAPIFE